MIVVCTFSGTISECYVLSPNLVSIGSYLALIYFSLISYGHSINTNALWGLVNKWPVRISSLFACGYAIA